MAESGLGWLLGAVLYVLFVGCKLPAQLHSITTLLIRRISIFKEKQNKMNFGRE